MIHLLPVAGRVPYRAGLEWQRDLAKARISGELDRDIVLLLEHEPVVTLGRGSSAAHVMGDAASLAAAGVDRVEIERGGDVTYHGPGQIVGYPIIDLNGYRRDLHWYLRRLEDSLILGLGELGVEAFTVDRFTGVWVGDPERTDLQARAEGRVRKIASIGVHVSRWVTWHGFALNLLPEALHGFRWIVPCGIESVRMTCVLDEGGDTTARSVYPALARGFGAAFGVTAELGGEIVVGEQPAFPEYVS